MFTDKAKTPALLKSLSLEYKNKLVVGEVKKKNAPKLVEQFGIDMFPALYVIPVSEPPKGYFGALQMDLIQKFLKPYLPATKFKAPEEPSDNPVQKIEYDPLIREVKTIGDFDEGCTKKAEVGYSSFCFMAFLPPLDEEFQESKDQREQLMDILKKLNRKFYGFIEAEMLPAVHFMFMDGFSSVGQDIIRKFGLSSDLPSGMILSPKKKLYIPLFTSFDEDSLTKYIKEAAKGKAKIFKYDGTISLPSGDATEQEAQEEKPTCGSDIDDLDDEESGGQCTFKNKDEL
jgi:protein disulfide-isomerase A6